MASEETFDQWAIVEVMGHRQYAGHVTEQTIGGASFLRVDVPETQTRPGYCKLLGASSIYAITPTTEDLVRRAVAAMYQDPIPVYIPPEPEPEPETAGALPPGRDYDFEDDF